jgi:hypothetical protein
LADRHEEVVMDTVARAPQGGARVGAGETGGRAAGAAAEAAGGPGRTLAVAEARRALGLGRAEFDLALRLGEVCAVPDPGGGGPRRIPAAEVARLLAAPGFPAGLRDRLRLVGAPEAAELLDVSRDRIVKLSRCGLIAPVGWYVNGYRVVVWVYAAADIRDLPARMPGLLDGRLPSGLLAELAAGVDRRAERWRQRRATELLREAHGWWPDRWRAAAVWAALLGPAALATAVPDPAERAALRELAPVLVPGAGARSLPAHVAAVLGTAAGDQEIVAVREGLAESLARGRAEQPLSAWASGDADPGRGRPVAAAASLPSPPTSGPLPTPLPVTDTFVAGAAPPAGAATDSGNVADTASGPRPAPAPQPRPAPAPLPRPEPHAASRPPAPAGTRGPRGRARRGPGRWLHRFRGTARGEHGRHAAARP